MLRMNQLNMGYYWVFCGLWIGFVCVPQMHAQPFAINQTPPRYQWKYVENDAVRLIASDTFSTRYSRALAARFHELYPYVKGNYVSFTQLPVVLRNYNALSNGFVSLFPRRMELFPVAPTANRLLGGHNMWFDLLVIHELRHVAQVAQLKANTRWLSFFYGEVGMGIASVFTPRWLWEGDAVLTETRLTRSGRGRLPAFQNLFLANLAINRRFHYDKARFGSLKHPIPNIYVLGYFMMSYMGQRYGEELFPKLWTFRFRRAIKKHTGQKLPVLYNQMLDHVDSLRLAQPDLSLTPYQVLDNQTAKRSHYRHPVVLDDGSIWVARPTLSDVRAWLCLTDPKQKYLPGPIGFNDYLSGRGRWIVWTERRYHPRFLDVNYSEIKLLDTHTNKVLRLKRQVRAMGVALSPDGAHIATVRYDPKGIYTLELWRVRDSEVLQSWPCAMQEELIAPRFNEEGDAILAIKTAKDGQHIMRYPLDGRAEEILLTSLHETLSHPTAKGNMLLYTTNYSGINEIHGLDLSNGRRYALTRSAYGSSHARFHTKRNSLVYQLFTPYGYRVVETSLDSLPKRPIVRPNTRALRYFTGQRLSEPTPVPTAQSVVTYSAQPLKDHLRAKHIFHLHSWGLLPPLLIATDPLNNWTWSANMQPTNFTNTFDINASAAVTYSGIAPVLSLEMRSAPLLNDLNKAQTPHQMSLNVRMPLWLTTSVFNQRLSLQTGWIHLIPNAHTPQTQLFDQMYYLADYQYTKQQAPRDILPTIGFTLSGAFLHSAPLFYANTFRKIQLRQRLYLNPTWPTHVLWMRNSFEQRIAGSPTFTLPIARTLTPYDKRLDKQLGLSLNYTFPIAYPDLSIAFLLYIKRISLNVFYDYGVQYFDHPVRPEQRYSTGIEIWNTSHILRIPEAVRSGFVFFYNAHNKKLQFQFNLNISGLF